MDLQQLQAELATRDDGILRHGKHPEGREFCGIEFARDVRGLPWGDTPDVLPDLRPLNDGPWSSDRARTAAVLPVIATLWNWSAWDPARRHRWATAVAIETVRQIIAELPSLPDPIRTQCQGADTLESARAAADQVLQRACAIWIAAAESSHA